MTAIVGARTPEAAEMAASIYEKVLEKGVVHKTDDLTAEMCKLTENTFRDVNIAYANELSVICDKMGIDVFELIKLANLIINITKSVACGNRIQSVLEVEPSITDGNADGKTSGAMEERKESAKLDEMQEKNSDNQNGAGNASNTVLCLNMRESVIRRQQKKQSAALT